MKQWNSNGGIVRWNSGVEQWNSHGGTVWWYSGTVMVQQWDREQCGYHQNRGCLLYQGTVLVKNLGLSSEKPT